MRLRASKSGRNWEEVNYHKALKMWFCSGNFLAPSRRRQNEKKNITKIGVRHQTNRRTVACKPQTVLVLWKCAPYYIKNFIIFSEGKLKNILEHIFEIIIAKLENKSIIKKTSVFQNKTISSLFSYGILNMSVVFA